MAKKLSAYNRHMSREMKKGKTFKQAVASWKARKRGGSKPKSRSNPRPKTRSRPRTRKVNPVAKRRGFLTASTFMSITRKLALAGPAAAIALGPGDAPSKIKEGVKVYTGFDMNSGTFNLADAGRGWLPYVATSVITWGIQKLNGIIRRL